MYLEHFGLHDYPFQLTPNTAYFYSRAGHREALQVLVTSLASGEGFICVTGEVGTGKTLLCRLLLREIQRDWVAVIIPNPALDPDSLRSVVADEFGVAAALHSANAHEMLRLLYDRLREISAEKRYGAVLIIDEAQVMADESLEMVRLLTNLETERDKLLQVVLVGQPELDRRLEQPHLRQLQQRCSLHQRLEPLPRQVVDDYLHHRLQTAGYRGRSLFSAPALRLLDQAAQGIPRMLNTLAHKSLIAAYGDAADVVGRSHVARAIADTEAVDRRNLPWRGWFLPRPHQNGRGRAR